MVNKRTERLEKLLVLAKASPTVSRKYEHLVCVGGLTEANEWRRIYPVPWKIFFGGRFKKKSWIEYEMQDNVSFDHRPESRKVNLNRNFTSLGGESFKEIKKRLDEKLTTLERLKKTGHSKASMGVVKPYEIVDFVEEDSSRYLKLKNKQKQQTLDGRSAIEIFIPKKTFSYVFKCSRECPKPHKITCEDWELTELYRKLQNRLNEGKYGSQEEVYGKIKDKFLSLTSKKDFYFILGTHFRFNTYIIISVIYPKKSDVY